jgi:outer membrane protein OmpA-like peptidoglycan-associated protein
MKTFFLVLMEIRARLAPVEHALIRAAFHSLVLRKVQSRLLWRIEMIRKTTVLTLAAAIALAGCVYPGGDPNRPANGALIGGLAGAVVGNAVGHTPRSAIIGGAVGAAIGGAIGADMERQERELSQQLAGTGVVVTNAGNHLVVNPGFLPALREMARSLLTYPNSTVLVVGHTDTVGTAAFNRQLSVDRASAVARILIGYGVSNNRISYAGRGFDQPIASNATSSGRAQNRRVEVLITPTN